MNQNKSSNTDTPKFVRSPSFPILTLDDAIGNAEIIYREDKRATTSYEAIITHLGYKPTKKRGGRSARAVSALKQYSLLDEIDGQFRISDKAFKIIEMPDNSPERARVLKEIALSPPAFRKILDYYNGELPSDTTLRSHLIFNEEFNPDSVADFIRILRGTLEVANLKPEDYNSDERKDTNIQEKPMSQQSQQKSHEPHKTHTIVNSIPTANTANPFPEPKKGESVLAFKITRDSEARVFFSGQVTQEGIKKLRALLELSEDVYPTQAELNQPKKAVWHNKDHDQPVTVTSELGEQDGKKYYAIEESQTGVPEDELEFNDE